MTYTKRTDSSVTVQAFQWTGEAPENTYPAWFDRAEAQRNIVLHHPRSKNAYLTVLSLNKDGWVGAGKGDFIVQHQSGDLSVYSPRAFQEMFKEKK